MAWARSTRLTWLSFDGAGYPIDTKIEARWVVSGSDGASELLGIVTPQGEIQVMVPGGAPVPVAKGWPQAIVIWQKDGLYATTIEGDAVVTARSHTRGSNPHRTP